MDQQQAWQLSRGASDTTEAVVNDVDWENRLVEVNLSGVTMRMPWFGPAPWPGSKVRVITAGLKPVCAAIFGSPVGTVQSTSGGRAVVLGDDGVTYRYGWIGDPGTAPVSAGQQVRLDHAGQVVLGRYSVIPSAPDYVPPPPPPPSQARSAWFDPIWIGNWRDGSFAGDAMEISSNRMAMAGWGTQVADSIADGAVITRAELHLPLAWDRVPGVDSSMGLHGFNGRPGGASNDNLSGDYRFSGSAGVVPILGAISDAFKVGSALGVGFRSGNFGWRQYGTPRLYLEWSG